MAAVKVQRVIDALARDLDLSKDRIMEQSLRTLLEKKLWEVKAEVFRLHGKYGVRSVKEMENCYRDGSLEEESTWRDFQLLDHLEDKKERLEKLLEELK